MKKKLSVVCLAVLLGAGIYFQEWVCGRSARGQAAGPAPARQGFGRVLSRSIADLCAKRSLWEEVLPEGRDGRGLGASGLSEPEQASAGTLTNGHRAKGGAPHASRFANHSQIQGVGEVALILGGNLESASLQKFMVRLESGTMLLIEHNTEVAPPVERLKLGDEVAFCGEYMKDLDGDVVRWTHKDPSARHAAGWLRHNGRTYQ